MLASLANNKLLQRDRKAAPLAGIIEKAWKTPPRVASLLRAIGKLKVDAYAPQVKAAGGEYQSSGRRRCEGGRAGAGVDSDRRRTGGPLIEKLTYEKVVATATKPRAILLQGRNCLPSWAAFSVTRHRLKKRPRGRSWAESPRATTAASFANRFSSPAPKFRRGLRRSGSKPRTAMTMRDSLLATLAMKWKSVIFLGRRPRSRRVRLRSVASEI